MLSNDHIFCEKKSLVISHDSRVVLWSSIVVSQFILLQPQYICNTCKYITTNTTKLLIHHACVCILSCIFSHLHFFDLMLALYPQYFSKVKLPINNKYISNFVSFFHEPKKKPQSFPIPYEFASYSPFLWPVRCCVIQWSDICTCCLRQPRLFSLTHYSFICTIYMYM